MLRRTRLNATPLESRLTPNNTPPVLVADINAVGSGSYPSNPLVVGGTLYFAATSNEIGQDSNPIGTELWRSDGDTATLVRNIFLTDGTGNSNPRELTEVNGKFFFAATSSPGRGLWVSDGTEAGTVRLPAEDPAGLTNVNGNLLFFATSPGNGRELWISDGTAVGTKLLADIAFGVASSSYGNETGVNVGGIFFFAARNQISSVSDGTELWRSDGTAAGTFIVADINPMQGSSFPGNLTEFNGKVAFTAQNGTSNEVWISDGTTGGTVPLTSFGPIAADYPIGQLTNVSGTLYFAAPRTATDNELFRSDGTAAGTVLAADINPGVDGSNPRNLRNVAGKLYFAADDGVAGRELFRFDTANGAVRLTDINSGTGNSNPGNITNVGGVVYFTADDGTGYELWRTTGGSPTLIDLQATSSANPSALIADGNRLYFSAFRSDVNTELFKLDEDNIPPTILVIDSPLPDGSYYTGASIPITVVFSEPVTLTGGLVLTLDSGGSVTLDPFTGTTATGQYFVATGHSSADLNVTAFSLVGTGTLKDAVGNDADLSTLPNQNLAVTSNLMINLPDTPPTVTDVPDFFVTAGTVIGPTIFMVSDIESPTTSLTASIISSNPGLIPASAVTFSGTSGERSLTIVTPSGVSGTATLTLVITDPSGNTATDTIVVSVNGPPTISSIANQFATSGLTVGPVPFTVGGNLSQPSELIVTAASNNTAIPLSAITFGGSGANRTISINTNPLLDAITTLTLTVTDPSTNFSASTTFDVVQTRVAPTISSIAAQSVPSGTSTGPLAFTLTSFPTQPDAITLSVTTDNPAITPGMITFGGGGANRTIDVATTAGLNTVTTITITALDPNNGLSASTTFAVTQFVPNTPPTISDVLDATVVAGGTLTRPFTVGDSVTPAAGLVVVATSDNPSLFPNGSIILGGSGANRTVTLNVPTGTTGTATITLRVTDEGNLSAVDTFLVTVSKVTTLPPSKEFSVGRGPEGVDGILSTVKFFNPDGSLRAELQPFGPDYTCGVRTATADITGDGVPDLVAAMGGHQWPSMLKVFDGVTLTEVFSFLPFGDQFNHGLHVSAGDMNGDGQAEFAITAEKGGGARVRIFSPSNGGFVQIADFFGLVDSNGVADTAFHGGARTAIGDLNNDGFGDLFFSAGTGGGPRVAIFDGKNLGMNGGPKLRGDFMAFDASLRNGSFLATGDINADGVIDLVAVPAITGGPRLKIFDGKALLSGQEVLLADMFVGNPNGRGGLRVAVKNLDNDQFMDVLVGGGPGDSNIATAYAGKDLMTPGPDAPLFEFEAFTGFPIGVWVG